MSYRNVRDAREGFVNMGAGDGLIRTESIILGIAIFIVGMTNYGWDFMVALVVGLVVAFVFPWLTGLISIFAWFVTIVFSLIWAVIGYFIGGAILGDSPIAGVIVALIVFIISFHLHKVYAGLGYSSVDRHVIDSLDETADNTSYTAHTTKNISSQVNKMQRGNNVCYCSSCGTPLKVGTKFCMKCGSQQ